MQWQELIKFFKGKTNEFKDSMLADKIFFLEKIRQDGPEKRKYCCVSPGGCLMCPNNIRLKIEDRGKLLLPIDIFDIFA